MFLFTEFLAFSRAKIRDFLGKVTQKVTDLILYITYIINHKSSEVTVREKRELSSVLVHLAKKWTKFSSSSFGKKVNWVQFKVRQKVNSVRFSVHFWNIFFLNFIIGVQTLKIIGSKRNVLKSGTVYKTEGSKKQWEI